MSIDISVYVGPYAEATVAVVEVIVDKCGEMNCRHTESGPHIGFCGQCGINLAKRFVSELVEEPNVNAGEVLEESGMLDAMCQCSQMCAPTVEEKNGKRVRRYRFRRYRFIGNKIKPEEPEREMMTDDASEDVYEDWSDVDFYEEMAWFREAYAKELAVLGVAYGRPLEIKWGLIKWCS